MLKIIGVGIFMLILYFLNDKAGEILRGDIFRDIFRR